MEQSVKACSDGQNLDVATILPTRLSGDALAYLLSVPQDVQKYYEGCTAKFIDVFGRKQFLLHFKMFVNVTQCLPKELLEVYAAEIKRLVQEEFPNNAVPALTMECQLLLSNALGSLLWDSTPFFSQNVSSMDMRPLNCCLLPSHLDSCLL